MVFIYTIFGKYLKICIFRKLNKFQKCVIKLKI